MDDVIIVGGSFAGLAAATQLGRARRKVTVLDTNLPRNRFAAAAHGVLGHDGTSPMALRALAREQLEKYTSVRILPIGAATLSGAIDNFSVTTQDGQTLTSRRVILAYGVNDTLPAIEGMAECWGKTAIHCPYCHAFEFSDQRLGVFYGSEGALHVSHLLQDWSGDITLFTNGNDLPEDAKASLDRSGVKIVTQAVAALDHDNGELRSVRLADGSGIGLDALLVPPRVTPQSDIAQQIGCAHQDGMLGPFITVDERQQTTIPGIFAAGDAARQMHNLTFATADGVMAGVSAHQSLLS